MTDDVPDQETAPQGPGKLARAALRAIDAGLAAIETGAGVLQRLRNRIKPTEAEGEDKTAEGKRRRSGDDEAAPIGAPVAAPSRKTLLHRFLIVVMCLLIGGITGMLISHRSFSRQLDAQERRLEFMQDDLKGARKDEMRIVGEKHKLQNEVAEHQNALREARQEIEERLFQIAELNARLSVARNAVRPADRVRPTPGPVAGQSRTPPKAGTCVTGTANPAGDLLDCIGKFNRQ